MYERQFRLIRPRGNVALALRASSDEDSAMTSALKTDLSHLPAKARRDLTQAVEILREEFARRTARGDAPHIRNGRILKIILFGSYARGRQVIDPVGRYFSDYDILVIVDHEDLTDAAEYWTQAEDRMVEMLTRRFWPQPLNLIVHSLDDFNHQLERGRYFFIDIVKEGIALFEEPGFPLAKPVPLSPEEARAEAQFYFDDDFTGIQRALATAAFQHEQAKTATDPKEMAKWRNEAAFQLHQATERAYYCILLGGWRALPALQWPRAQSEGDRRNHQGRAWRCGQAGPEARTSQLRGAHCRPLQCRDAPFRSRPRLRQENIERQGSARARLVSARAARSDRRGGKVFGGKNWLSRRIVLPRNLKG